MTGKAIVLRVALVVTLVNSSVLVDLMAGDIHHLHGAAECGTCKVPVCARCDDYCAKPFPCTTCRLGCNRCDDYCRKSCPELPCGYTCFRCDDYCRPPLPCVVRPQLICDDDYHRKPLPPISLPARNKAISVPDFNDNLDAPIPSARRLTFPWTR